MLHWWVLFKESVPLSSETDSDVPQLYEPRLTGTLLNPLWHPQKVSALTGSQASSNVTCTLLGSLVTAFTVYVPLQIPEAHISLFFCMRVGGKQEGVSLEVASQRGASSGRCSVSSFPIPFQDPHSVFRASACWASI